MRHGWVVTINTQRRIRPLTHPRSHGGQTTHHLRRPPPRQRRSVAICPSLIPSLHSPYLLFHHIPSQLTLNQQTQSSTPSAATEASSATTGARGRSSVPVTSRSSLPSRSTRRSTTATTTSCGSSPAAGGRPSSSTSTVGARSCAARATPTATTAATAARPVAATAGAPWGVGGCERGIRDGVLNEEVREGCRGFCFPFSFFLSSGCLGSKASRCRLAWRVCMQSNF